MKGIFLIAVLTLATGLLYAQSTISGTWVVDTEESLEAMTSNQRTKYDTIPDRAKQRARQSMDNKEFIFNSNGSLVVHWKSNGNAVRSSGSWTVDENRSVLKLTVDSVDYEYEYSLPSSEALVLKALDQAGYFPVLYLKLTSR